MVHDLSFLSLTYYNFFSTNVYKYAIHCRQIYCSEGQRDFAGKALLLNAVVVVAIHARRNDLDFGWEQ